MIKLVSIYLSKNAGNSIYLSKTLGNIQNEILGETLLYLLAFFLQVIRTNETSDETYQKMMAWGKAIGKVTITCKDTPGFVVNRLLVPILLEAIRMYERGKVHHNCNIFFVLNLNR